MTYIFSKTWLAPEDKRQVFASVEEARSKNPHPNMVVFGDLMDLDLSKSFKPSAPRPNAAPAIVDSDDLRDYSEPNGQSARYQLRRDLPVVAASRNPVHDVEQDPVAPCATGITELAAIVVIRQHAVSRERILAVAGLRGSSAARKPVLQPPPPVVVKLRSDQAIEHEWAERVFEGDLNRALPPDPHIPVVAKLWSNDYIRRWSKLVVVGDIDPTFPSATPQAAPVPNAAPAVANGDDVASFRNRYDNRPIMIEDEILSAAAEHFGLDAKSQPHLLLAQALAQLANTSVDAAQTIIDATLANATGMAEAGKNFLKPKPEPKPKSKFISKDDLSAAELTDPKVIRDAIDFANSHQKTRIAALEEGEANKLRRARLIQKYDIDRRQKGIVPTMS